MTVFAMRSRSLGISFRAFAILLSSFHVLRFLLDGHLPLAGFDDYGVAHYVISEFGFLLENLLIVGLAMVGSIVGWRAGQDQGAV